MAKRPVYPVTPPGGSRPASSNAPVLYRPVGSAPCEADPQASLVVNDCSAPMPVASCPGAPLEVIVRASDVPQIDVEKTGYLCSAATNTWVCEIITFTDGVETARSQIDSGVDCSEDPPQDPEIFTVESCVLGFINVQPYQILFVDGIAQPAAAIGSPVVTTTRCGTRTEPVLDCDGNIVKGQVDSVVKIEGVIQTLPCPSPTWVQREVCLEMTGGVIYAYAILDISTKPSTLSHYENAAGEVVSGTVVNCDCDAVDILQGPASDPCSTLACANGKGSFVFPSRTPCNASRAAFFRWANDGYYPTGSWFMAQFAFRGISENWDIDWGDGTVVSGSVITNQTHQYTSAGHYTVTVTLNSPGNPCSGDQWTVEVDIV